MTSISYSIPYAGHVEIPLYPPADTVHEILRTSGEINRLSRLRHIGALEIVYPGVSHSRWDYTVSILHAVTRLRRAVSNSAFSIGAAQFSSIPAALQCLALLANIGHLPGTYAVEKGVARFLLAQDPKAPLSPLFTRRSTSRRNREIASAADEALGEARLSCPEQNTWTPKADFRL